MRERKGGIKVMEGEKGGGKKEDDKAARQGGGMKEGGVNARRGKAA